MSNRHAYLVMAHHRPDLLRLLLEELDDPRNDIFLHIDRKAGEDMDPSCFCVKKSRLTVIPSMKVEWAGYSQVACGMRLLKAAVKTEDYAYVHMMSGATYPLRTQDEIHAFFEANAGREFMEISSRDCEERVKYRWIFNEIGKRYKTDRRYWQIHRVQQQYGIQQKRRGVDRFRRYGMVCRKGLAYWSITGGLAAYLVSREKLIQRMMRHSIFGDEIFVQTIAYNSPFRKNIFDGEGRPNESLRATTWGLENEGHEREEHNFSREDIPYLRQSDALFALKFEGEDGVMLIRQIREWMEEHRADENPDAYRTI